MTFNWLELLSTFNYEKMQGNAKLKSTQKCIVCDNFHIYLITLESGPSVMKHIFFKNTILKKKRKNMFLKTTKFQSKIGKKMKTQHDKYKNSGKKKLDIHLLLISKISLECSEKIFSEILKILFSKNTAKK